MKILFYIMLLTSFSVAQNTLGFLGLVQEGYNGVDGILGAHSVAVSPDNKNVYAIGFNDDGLAVFNRDISTGMLTFGACFKDGQNNVDGLDWVYSVMVSPDNKNVYAIGYSDDALVVFSRDALTGALVYDTCYKDGQGGVDGLNGAAAVVVSPDNKNVYVAGFIDDALAVFNRDTLTGTLVFDTCFKDGQNGVDGLDGAVHLMASPDNKNVYLTGKFDNAVVIFNRDTLTGMLVYDTCLKDNQGGIYGLGLPAGVVVSPDNRNVYVAGQGQNALAVFDRDIATGALTYSTYFKDGQNGVDGLSEAVSIAVSPDNQSVFVAGYNDNALAVFDRNISTGALAYRTCFKDGQGGIDGLNRAGGVAVSPDNGNVYVASENDNALAIFNIISVSTVFPVAGGALSKQNTMLSVFPNPFNSVTKISYQLYAKAQVKIEVYTMEGVLIDVLSGGIKETGSHSMSWNAGKFGSGVYCLKLTAGAQARKIKMVMIK